MSLGLAVITFNEAHNIERCLRSVPFASQVVVVDSGSRDTTREIAAKLGAQVIERHWKGYADQKQFAMEQLSTDWVLALDADEELLPETAEEIQKLILDPAALEAYRIPRRHYFLGRMLKHGKGVDDPVRLLRRGRGHYNDRNIHEEILVDGSIGRLTNGMNHFSSDGIRDRLRKIERDTEMELNNAAARRPSTRERWIEPATYFLSYVLRRQGWRDGIPGAIWTGLFAYQIYVQQSKFQKRHDEARRRGNGR